MPLISKLCPLRPSFVFTKDSLKLKLMRVRSTNEFTVADHLSHLLTCRPLVTGLGVGARVALHNTLYVHVN